MNCGARGLPLAGRSLRWPRGPAAPYPPRRVTPRRISTGRHEPAAQGWGTQRRGRRLQQGRGRSGAAPGGDARFAPPRRTVAWVACRSLVPPQRNASDAFCGTDRLVQNASDAFFVNFAGAGHHGRLCSAALRAATQQSLRSSARRRSAGGSLRHRPRCGAPPRRQRVRLSNQNRHFLP